MKTWELADLMLDKTIEFWQSGIEDCLLQSPNNELTIRLSRSPHKLLGSPSRVFLEIVSISIQPHLQDYNILPEYISRIEAVFDIYVRDVRDDWLVVFFSDRNYREDIQHGWNGQPPCYYRRKL